MVERVIFCREIEGKKQRVIPRDFKVHPFRPKALAINWLRYREGQLTRACAWKSL